MFALSERDKHTSFWKRKEKKIFKSLFLFQHFQLPFYGEFYYSQREFISITFVNSKRWWKMVKVNYYYFLQEKITMNLILLFFFLLLDSKKSNSFKNRKTSFALNSLLIFYRISSSSSSSSTIISHKLKS